ncbi:MAG: hypothetical protein IBX62_08795 [Coriobacteriia bacterium]|nr:hypothetical protein [Coriobacteriia bacterium]
MRRLEALGLALLAAVTGALWAFTAALWVNVAGLASPESLLGQLAMVFLLALPGAIPGLLITGTRPFSREVAALSAGLVATALLGGPFVWAALSALRAAPAGSEAWALYSLPFLPLAAYGTYRAFAAGGSPAAGLAALSVVSAAFGVALLLQRLLGGTGIAEFVLLALAPPLGAAAGLGTAVAARAADALARRRRLSGIAS